MKTPHILCRFLLVPAALLTLTCGAHAQGPAAALSGAAPQSLMITILEGEGALNDVRARTAREPIVEVTDENHRPVAGAIVLFVSDTNGSGGLGATFNGAQAFSMSTDAEGRATGHGFQLTRTTGRFHITVQARKGDAHAQAVISEINVLAISRFSLVNHAAEIATSKTGLLATLEIVGVAVAAGVTLASAPATPVTITTGPGGVGAPTAAGIRIQLHGRRR